MRERRRQGLLPFRMEAASRPMDLTAQAGLTLVAEALLALGMPELVRASLRVGQRQRGLSTYEKFEWLILLLAAGGERIEDIRVLGRDRGLARLLGHAAPSPDALHDFLGSFHEDDLFASRPETGAWIPGESEALGSLHEINRVLVHRAVSGLEALVATLDLDATIVESHRREALPHYQGGRGFQPVVVLWSEEDLVVADQFRDGNVPAAMRNLEVVERAMVALPPAVRERYFRGDSACYDERLLRWLWQQRIGFTISADMSQELRRVCLDAKLRWDQMEERPNEIVEATEVEFAPGNWPRDAPPMRYVALRFTAKQGRLFADGSETKYLAVVSNREDLPAFELLRWHWAKAGTIEQTHAVVKNDLGGGFVPSRRFGANAAWFRFNLITYNVLTVLKRRALPERLREARPKRLRYEIFTKAAVLRTHARELVARVGDAPLSVDELVIAREKLLALRARWTNGEEPRPLDQP